MAPRLSSRSDAPTSINVRMDQESSPSVDRTDAISWARSFVARPIEDVARSARTTPSVAARVRAIVAELLAEVERSER